MVWDLQQWVGKSTLDCRKIILDLGSIKELYHGDNLNIQMGCVKHRLAGKLILNLVLDVFAFFCCWFFEWTICESFKWAYQRMGCYSSRVASIELTREIFSFTNIVLTPAVISRCSAFGLSRDIQLWNFTVHMRSLYLFFRIFAIKISVLMMNISTTFLEFLVSFNLSTYKKTFFKIYLSRIPRETCTNKVMAK